jgi:hypothetical protein
MTLSARGEPNRYTPTARARIFLAALNWAARIALRVFEKRTIDAESANLRTLLKIVRRNSRTRFGRKHQLVGVSAADSPVQVYKSRVRLSRFTDYTKQIDDICDGQANVLTRDTIDLLAGSSGTTANSKRLPNTKKARRIFMFFALLVQQGVALRAFYASHPNQRGINLMSSYTPHENCGVRQRVTSANNAGMQSLRKYIPILWSSPADVFEIGHQPTACYLHALFGLADRNISHLAAIFAPHLTSLFAVIEENHAQIVRDIETGTISPNLQLSPTEKHSIESHLNPDPLRALELKTEFKKGFNDIVLRLWPETRYIATVSTGSFSIYVPHLKQLTGDRIPIFSPCHASSEAMIGINISPERNDYVLALGSAFFEFIPLSHSDEAQPETIDVDQLEVGREYEVVLTNFAGLYRYRLDDIIQILGFHKRAPIFKFLYRRGTILNLVGEKITENHTAQAITASVNQWLGPKAALRDYTVVSEICGGLSRYVFFAELKTGVDIHEKDASHGASILDRELCKANYYYWSNGRNAERLAPAKLNLVKPGTFGALNEQQDIQSGGSVTTQIKTPRVIKDRRQIELLEGAVIYTSSGTDNNSWDQTPVG